MRRLKMFESLACFLVLWYLWDRVFSQWALIQECFCFCWSHENGVVADFPQSTSLRSFSHFTFALWPLAKWIFNNSKNPPFYTLVWPKFQIILLVWEGTYALYIYQTDLHRWAVYSGVHDIRSRGRLSKEQLVQNKQKLVKIFVVLIFYKFLQAAAYDLEKSTSRSPDPHDPVMMTSFKFHRSASYIWPWPQPLPSRCLGYPVWGGEGRIILHFLLFAIWVGAMTHINCNSRSKVKRWQMTPLIFKFFYVRIWAVFRIGTCLIWTKSSI